MLWCVSDTSSPVLFSASPDDPESDPEAPGLLRGGLLLWGESVVFFVALNVTKPWDQNSTKKPKKISSKIP